MVKKIIKPEWQTHMAKVKKARDKVLARLCTNCRCTFEQKGISAYDGICKVCAGEPA